MGGLESILILAIAVGGVALLTSLRILFEYERGVVFRLGKLTRARGPGLIFLVPFGVERMKKIDLLPTVGGCGEMMPNDA